MAHATLEHINYCTPDSLKTAAWMADVFGWKIRWQGDGGEGGRTIHMGGEHHYLALHCPSKKLQPWRKDYAMVGQMNHIGVLVNNLDETEEKVKSAGFTPVSHADYEPGRRFYFYDDAGVEFEVISYSDGH